MQTEYNFSQAIKNPYTTTEHIVGSWRMEYLEISPETIRDMHNMAIGEISLDEALVQVKQRLSTP